MLPMPAVSSVEQMEQRAEQDQQIGQEAEEMGRMLGDQEKSGDREKYPQNDPTAQPQSTARWCLWCRCPRIHRLLPSTSALRNGFHGLRASVLAATPTAISRAHTGPG